MGDQRAVVIGAGPAGLTAAYELLTRTSIQPVVLEQDDIVGGISRTVNYKGNRIDLGGHRFFSKSDRVMKWWAELLPLEQSDNSQLALSYQGRQHSLYPAQGGPDPTKTDAVMLLRQRKSRIYYLRKFFDYPIGLNKSTIVNLGLPRMARIGVSYIKARLLPIRDERNLEQFFINRFGRELYLTFFKSYTEKVWGVPCDQISASWGAQRIKGLSVAKALTHALTRPFRKKSDVAQKKVETSLVEQFLYPKYGPGQMWEACTERVRQMGGEVLLNMRVQRLHVEKNRVWAVVAQDRATGREQVFEADYVFSTMPVQELVRAVDAPVPADIRQISEGLVYRDFITVGVLVDNLKIRDDVIPGQKLIADNWIYIQEPDVLVGRLQIFNNWSPYMVADPSKVWIGLEYFCYEGDHLWKLGDAEMAALAIDELAKIGIIEKASVRDHTVLRMPKTYPAYFGSYDRFGELQAWLDRFTNLFLVGRNGMHRYNNQDHSMLTAMTAVDNIRAGRTDKSNIWAVNTEQDYHEAQDTDSSSAGGP
jgi:protoporphyrinogen oxidase